MNFNNLLFASVNAAAFMLSASFLIYITSIVVPFLRHRPDQPGDSTGFQWHFVVPCLDEERVIEQTIARLRADFADGHVWVIDDASADDTPRILDRLARFDSHIHVVTRRLPDAQVGKGPALNSAWAALVDWLPEGRDAAEVIVGVIDADGYLDPGCLPIVSGSRYFGNAEVSAVQIQVRVSNGDHTTAETPLLSRVLVRMQDMEFTTLIAAIQMLRHNVGSVGMGGNGQFTRLSALNSVAAEFGGPWRDALIEDFELGLHVLLTGGHNEYCHETWVSQQGPPTFRRLVRQRSRWGQGVMQCIRYLAPVLRSPRISTGAAVEITYFLVLPWIQILGDVVYLIALLTLIYAAFTVPQGPFHWLGEAGAWQLIPMFVIFGLGPLFIWGPIYRKRIAKELTRRQAVVLGIANWPYIFVHHCAVWWAFSRVVRSRHDWKKTERLDRRVPQPVLAQAEFVPAGLAPAAAAEPVLVPAGATRLEFPPTEPAPRHRPGPTPSRPRSQPARPAAAARAARSRPGQGRLVVEGRLRVASHSAAPVRGRLVLTAGPIPSPEAPPRGDAQSPSRYERQPARLRTG